MFLVGLGNPGPAYAGTRHNLGAGFIERLTEEHGVKLKAGKHGVRTADVRIGGRAVTIGIPSSFMNDSGRGVARACAKFGMKPGSLVIAYDELDLPLGRVRLKLGGGAGGHNGVKSVMDSLRSKDFMRLRLGIGRPPTGTDSVDQVLSRFNPEEKELIPGIFDSATKALELLISEDLDAAQRWLHTNT